jgi:multiple RNA-binding domain-containing protein 1
MKQHF